MAVTSYKQQLQRRLISNTCEPAGFDRFPQQQAILREMNVLGGIGDDEAGGNPDRYRAL